MEILYFIILLECIISFSSYVEGTDKYTAKNYPSISERLRTPAHFMNWYNKELDKEDQNRNAISYGKYDRPAVMEGGLLSAQVPRHTLIAIDRFLKILKTLAGLAIVLAISMPFVQILTTSITEVLTSYF